MSRPTAFDKHFLALSPPCFLVAPPPNPRGFPLSANSMVGDDNMYLVNAPFRAATASTVPWSNASTHPKAPSHPSTPMHSANNMEATQPLCAPRSLRGDAPDAIPFSPPGRIRVKLSPNLVDCVIRDVSSRNVPLCQRWQFPQRGLASGGRVV